MRVAAALALSFTFACAGAGNVYPCDADAGACGPHDPPDGGPIDLSFVSKPRMVWHDGAQNASADLVAFNGQLYAVFRHANVWSIDTSSQLFVVKSADGKAWTKTATLAIADRDLRQPKLAVFAGKLVVVATAWEGGSPVAHKTSVRIAGSADGETFTDFASVEQAGLAAWRPRVFGSSLFLSIWAADELVPPSSPNALTLLSTGDGVAFTPAGTPPAGPGAREGELFVRANGDRWMALPERSVGTSAEKQTFCSAPSTGALAWTCWSVATAAVESPLLFEWNRVLFVAGKRDAGKGLRRTSIWQIIPEEQSLSLVADLPGIGDTGSPGISFLDDERALLTFHSTSSLDERVLALGHEPTEVETQSAGFPADVIAVELFFPNAPAGR